VSKVRHYIRQDDSAAEFEYRTPEPRVTHPTSASLFENHDAGHRLCVFLPPFLPVDISFPLAGLLPGLFHLCRLLRIQIRQFLCRRTALPRACIGESGRQGLESLEGYFILSLITDPQLFSCVHTLPIHLQCASVNPRSNSRQYVRSSICILCGANSEGEGGSVWYSLTRRNRAHSFYHTHVAAFLPPL